MIGRRSDWLPKRPGMLMPVVAVHVGVMLLLMIGGTDAAIAPALKTRLTVFDVTSTPDPVTRPSETRSPSEILSEVPVIPAPPVVTPILFAAAAPAGAVHSGEGIDCDLTAAVETAVRESPPARSALLMLPRDRRSVANAVMLWDGRWADGTTTSTRYALGKVREIVLASVAAASPDCRAAVQAGPRLAVVPGAPDIVIAFGSGRWRWGDLVPQPSLTIATNDVPEQGGPLARLASEQRPN